jgi:hypothetical protein
MHTHTQIYNIYIYSLWDVAPEKKEAHERMNPNKIRGVLVQKERHNHVQSYTITKLVQTLALGCCTRRRDTQANAPE